MEKLPIVSPLQRDSDLSGSKGESSWQKGLNCVYSDSTVARFRVSIKTDAGWKSYGHFEDVGVAGYVANVAILVEGREGFYGLNEMRIEGRTLDRAELAEWRRRGNNAELEQVARERFNEVRSALVRMAAEKQAEAQKLADEIQAKRVAVGQVLWLTEERKAAILSLPNGELVDFVKGGYKTSSERDFAMAEAVRRFRQAGKSPQP